MNSTGDNRTTPNLDSKTSPLKRKRHSHGTSILFNGDKWINATLKGKLPERRSNMGYFVDSYTHNLYIFGGHDLKEGRLNSLWRISMEDVKTNMGNAKWDRFTTKSEPPSPNSHLTGFIYHHKLFLFGGSFQESDDPRELDTSKCFLPPDDLPKPLMFNVLNLQTLIWSKWRKKNFASYDDFASQFFHKLGHLYVFGGFKDGRKCNELYYIDMANKVQNVLS